MVRDVVVGWVVIVAAGAASADEGSVPLFNGEDLSGWVNVNVAPGTFGARDGMIVSTGKPTGVMRTERQYENFVLELEWRHMVAGGNAGLFVWSDGETAPGVPFTRSIEVQILDGRNTETYTSHGDVFAIHGAVLTPDRPHPKGAMRCLPSEHRCKPAGEWNHYRVTCLDGALKLEVNGKEVSGGSECSPRKGYICLESEGSECHFRNLRIKELPSSNPRPEETAEVARGFAPIYTGLDLSGWRVPSADEAHWKAKDWVLAYDGGGGSAEPCLWTEREYGDFELICDWRLTGKPKKVRVPKVLRSGEVELDESGEPVEVEVLSAGGSGICLRGSTKAEVNISDLPIGSGDVVGYREDRSLPADVRAVVTPKVAADKPPGQWNRFVITVRGERITVRLNGRTVVEGAALPGVSLSGRIGLVMGEAPVEFASLLVRELGPGE